MKPRFWLRIFLLLLVLAVTLSACEPEDNDSSTLVYGLTLIPSGLDPHINASAELGIPLSSVYDTLVFRDPATGDFVPGLARAWTISEDGRAYTFLLREDVRFHDGTDFDAAAVAANLDYITNPDHRSQKAVFMLGPYQGWTIEAPYTITIHLSEPYAPLLDSLSQVYLGMASPAALERWGAGEYQFHQVGTGPYRFVQYIPGDQLTLERNPDYAWAPDIYQAESASIETIIFRFFTDAATRGFALETGQVDVLGEVPPNEALRLDSLDDFRLLRVPIPGIPLQFIFNTQIQPTVDPAIRTALLQLLDRQAIVTTIFRDTSPVATGPLTKNLLVPDENTRFPEQNLAVALETLEEAGWSLSGEGLRVNPEGEVLSLRMVVPPWGYASEVAQLMAAGWEQAGIAVDVVLVPGFGSLLEAQQDGNYHLIALNEFNSDPSVLNAYYSSDGLYNWSGYQSEQLDNILVAAVETTLANTDRLELYREIAYLVRQETLIIPIRDYVNLVVAHKRVEGLRFSVQGWFPYLIDVRLTS